MYPYHQSLLKYALNESSRETLRQGGFGLEGQLGDFVLEVITRVETKKGASISWLCYVIVCFLEQELEKVNRMFYNDRADDSASVRGAIQLFADVKEDSLPDWLTGGDIEFLYGPSGMDGLESDSVRISTAGPTSVYTITPITSDSDHKEDPSEYCLDLSKIRRGGPASSHQSEMTASIVFPPDAQFTSMKLAEDGKSIEVVFRSPSVASTQGESGPGQPENENGTDGTRSNSKYFFPSPLDRKGTMTKIALSITFYSLIACLALTNAEEQGSGTLGGSAGLAGYTDGTVTKKDLDGSTLGASTQDLA